MSPLEGQPIVRIESMRDLLAVAAAAKQQAIAAYSHLAERMRGQGRDDLASTFERLAAASGTQLEAIERRATAETGARTNATAPPEGLEFIFDDEGAGDVAPELLSGYRIFSTAVRNEERAFAFWSYLAADSALPDIKLAAEQLAREQLEHIAALRRERRRAFHAQRAATLSGEGPWTLVALEERLADLLDQIASADAEAGKKQFEAKARRRAEALRSAPLGEPPLLGNMPMEATTRLQPCAQLLLECYLDLAERLRTQEERDRAQRYAAQLLELL